MCCICCAASLLCVEDGSQYGKVRGKHPNKRHDRAKGRAQEERRRQTGGTVLNFPLAHVNMSNSAILVLSSIALLSSLLLSPAPVGAFMGQLQAPPAQPARCVRQCAQNAHRRQGLCVLPKRNAARRSNMCQVA